MGKNKPSYLIVRHWSFYEKLTEYTSDPRFVEARKMFNTRKYSTGDLDVPYRVMHHWELMEMLPDGMKTAGWRKFTFIELVWIRAIVIMREFGMALEKIKTAKECVMRWNEKNQDYAGFELQAALALWSDIDTYLVIAEDGTADIGSINELAIMHNLDKSILHSTILIPFRLLLKEFEASSKNLPEKLTTEERELLFDIRGGKNSELRITVDQTGEIGQIESMRTFTEADFEKNREINQEIKNEKMYGKVETQYENGDRRSVKVVKRKRFDK